MEKTGFYKKGISGLEFIDPTKLVSGQRKSPNVFILKETTAIAIDSIPANTPAGAIVVNVDGFWGISGSVQVKEIIDVSGGNLPNSGVFKDDIYLIGVGGTVNGIDLVSGDKVQAKIDDPTQDKTGGIFDDWILIEAPTVSTTSIVRPNGDSVEESLVDLQTNLDVKVPISDIVDNLISTNTNKPLSALQGKNLLESVFFTQDIMAYKVPSPTNNNFVKHDSSGDIEDAGVSAVSFNGANQIVKLDANAKLEAIDGSALTNVSASQPRGSYVKTIATSVTGAIACDGSSYSKTTYSDLYALITAELGANALEDSGNSSNFVLPNLEGRVIGVAGGGRNLFDLVGSDTHTLSTNEIPSHSHGYSKGYFPGSASGSVTNAGAGYFWGYITSTTNNAGGGAAHSIAQKTSYIAKKIFIFY